LNLIKVVSQIPFEQFTYTLDKDNTRFARNVLRRPGSVMRGLDPRIQAIKLRFCLRVDWHYSAMFIRFEWQHRVAFANRRSWMPGSSPGMTR
jgi:hypothetical protein